MNKFFFLLVFISLLMQKAIGQDKKSETFLTVNGNLLYPLSNPDQGVYPIFSYNKNADPSLSFGGFGIGISSFHNASEISNISIKLQANFSRHKFWDETSVFRDGNNSLLGYYKEATIDYSFGLAGTGQYKLSKYFYAGLGFGTRFLVKSFSKIPEFQSFGVLHNASNDYYKKIMPVIPIEISYKTQKWLFNIRYEQAILNRYKKELSKYKDGTYGLLTFEAGLRIN